MDGALGAASPEVQARTGLVVRPPEPAAAHAGRTRMAEMPPHELVCLFVSLSKKREGARLVRGIRLAADPISGHTPRPDAPDGTHLRDDVAIVEPPPNVGGAGRFDRPRSIEDRVVVRLADGCSAPRSHGAFSYIFPPHRRLETWKSFPRSRACGPSHLTSVRRAASATAATSAPESIGFEK